MDPIKQISICRFCLAEEDLLTDCTLHDDAVHAKIITIFSFPIYRGASLPSSLCTGCYLKMDEYYEFTELVRLNQVQLLAREALTSEVNIKIESTEEEFLEKPIITKEPVPTDCQTTIIKTEVVTEDDEEQVVGNDSNQSIVQGQDEAFQSKIEFEDTELQSEGEPSVDRASEIAKEDRLINDFFSLNCQTCSIQFDSFTLLKLHTRATHNKELSFTCCNKQYTRRYKVLAHIALHKNPHRFQCDSCDKKYEWKQDLKKHRLLAHGGEEERSFKCDQCTRSYPKQSLLTSHMAKHVPMECNVCHKVLSDSDSLRLHKKHVHRNANKAKKHICDICGKELRSKIAMYRHKMQLHETDNPAAQVECSHCRRSFASKESLKVHLKTIPNNEARCDVCDQMHPNRKALLAHMARIHVEATHECDVCGKKFKMKTQLMTHYAIHTGKKLYSCNLCGLQINSSNNWYAHRKKKHAKEWAEMKQKER